MTPWTSAHRRSICWPRRATSNPATTTCWCSQLGSLDALLDATDGEIQAIELQAGHKQRLRETLAGGDPAAELAKLAEQGIAVVGWGDELYPELLARIPDAPLMLFCRGDIQLMRHDGISIVGSRKCSERGRELAREFGGQLAEVGVPVVSGMALGIDGAAHTGALEAPGPTVAVLGCGVDVVYPPRHQELYERLVAQALVVSEYPPGVRAAEGALPPAQPHHQRAGARHAGDRSAAGQRSADHGAHRQRAGPRGVRAARSDRQPLHRGTHDLIKRGHAKLVENVDDILVEFGTTRAALRVERFAKPSLPFDEPAANTIPAASGASAGAIQTVSAAVELSADEQHMLAALSYEGTHVNSLVRKLGISTQECITRLTMLEIKGLISAAGSGYYVRL